MSSEPEPRVRRARPARAAGPEPDLDLVVRRVGQFLLDAALASGVAYLIADLIGFLSFDPAYNGPSPAGVISTMVLTALTWATVFVLIPALGGDRTIGMRLLDLRVVAADGARPGVGRHLVRSVLLVVDTLVAGLVGLVTMLRSHHARRVGDMVAGTRVVRASTG